MSQLQMVVTVLAIATLVACYAFEAAIRHATDAVVEAVASEQVQRDN